jgi:hypothetical protein
MQEGQIVRNKRTGQMGRLVGGQVVPIDQGPINSGPRPSDVTAARNSARGDAQFAYQVQRDAAEDARDAEKRALEEQERIQQERAIDAKEQDVLVDSLRRIQLIDEVYADATNEGSMFGSLGEVGYWGNKLSETGNTAAYDLAQKISTLQGVEAIDKLLEVKSDPRNPTGGAFGALSDRELTLLKNYTGSLAQGQSIEEFQRGLGRIKRAALDIVKKMAPERYEAIINRGSPRFNANGSITYDQQGEALFGVQPDESILGGSAGATEVPSDIDAIMKKYGAGQ